MGLPPPRKSPASSTPDGFALPAPPARPSSDKTGSEPAERSNSAWKARSADYGAPRFDAAREQEKREDRLEQIRRRTGRRSKLLIVFIGGLAFLTGWITAYQTFTIPGVFLASQVGIPALLAIVLTGTARVLRTGIHDIPLAHATGALARAAAWALGAFWLFITFTNVWQLAVSMALAILAFQLYATYDRLRRAGHHGFGPGLSLTLVPLGAYLGWLLVFNLAGALAPTIFDLVSMTAAFIFAFVHIQKAKQAARRAATEHQADPAVAAAAPQARGATAKHLLVGVIVGYLFFRFFVSANIPYGPIVEWWIVSLAALFFAIFAAGRIGTVPTKKSLPPPHVRTHQQRVWSLPDQHLLQIEKHLAAYIRDNKQKDWVQAHYQDLLESSGVPRDQARKALADLDRHRTSEKDRRALILALTRLMDETNGHTTDNMKTNPALAATTTKTPSPTD